MSKKVLLPIPVFPEIKILSPDFISQVKLLMIFLLLRNLKSISLNFILEGFNLKEFLSSFFYIDIFSFIDRG